MEFELMEKPRKRGCPQKTRECRRHFTSGRLEIIQEEHLNGVH